MKASDKQSFNKKIVTAFKKRYKGGAPKQNLPVLETILFTICLENSPYEQAEAVYERIFSDFTDLNEVRVSSVGELEPSFVGVDAPEWKAMRVRTVLQHVFETSYSFEFEVLRKKTLDLAGKKLAKIKVLTPFVRTAVLQASLGAHVVPLDDHMHKAAIWLGLVEPGLSIDDASDSLKAVVRKSDSPLFCHLLRQFSQEPRLIEEMADFDAKSEIEYDLTTAPARMEELYKRKAPRKKTKKAAKKTTKKTTKKATKKTKKSATTKKKVPAKKSTATKKSSATKKKTTAKKKTAVKKKKTASRGSSKKKK